MLHGNVGYLNGMSTEGREASEPSSADDGLLPQLRLIEDQPLAARADAFTQIHDRLKAQLEGGDSAARHA